MADPAVELVAGGPPPAGPYDPAAPAWALAEGLHGRGWSVRVLYPDGGTAVAPPDGIAAVPVPLPLRRPGAAVEPAEFSRAAGHRLRRDANLVIRDPLGLGPLGVHRLGRHPRVVGFVRSLELAGFDTDRARRKATRVVDRLDAWRDRRAVRRLERTALEEADDLWCDGNELAGALGREYGVGGGRLKPAVSAVSSDPSPPTRTAARAALGFPIDVPVVAALAAFDDPAAAGVDRALEAFRRMRPLFPGVRMVIVGAPSGVDPGVTVSPDRDSAAFARALAAADLAVFARRAPGFDPGVILALRAGVPAITLPAVRLPIDPGRVVRAVASDDPGDFSSALAELIADPAARHALQEPGRAYAARFLPERAAAEIEGGRGSP